MPALQPLKLVVGLDLRARGDTQQYRIQLPGPTVTKDIGADARVRVEIPRTFFNELAKDGRVADWREAFMYGQAISVPSCGAHSGGRLSGAPASCAPAPPACPPPAR